MTREEMVVLTRRMSRRDQRQAKATWFGLGIGGGCQVFAIVFGFMASWTQGVQAIVQGVIIFALLWIPILLHMRKTRLLSNASMIASSIIRTMGESEEEHLADEDHPFDSLFLKLVILKIGVLAWGTPEGKWKDGCDPYHSHPDDRRRRLLELLTIAAWRDLPDVPYTVRLDMIALAQICIAAEVLQSRSISGRIRNLLLRLFARRARCDAVRHIVPIAAASA